MSYKKYQLTVRPIEIGDFDSFEPIELQAGHHDQIRNIMNERGWPAHQAIGFDKDGRAILMSGWFEMWPGVYDVWTLFSKDWNPRYYKSATDWFKNYCGLMEFTRAQHILFESRMWMVPVLERFGFEREAYLKKYINGENCYIYSIIKGE